jgi:hypothetical protein
MKLGGLSAIPALAGVGMALGASATGAAMTLPLDAARAMPAYFVLAQSEVYVPQASGYLRHSVLPPVGGPSKASGANGGLPQGEPITCNWTNSTSPDCYAATQQGKPMPK